MLASEWKLIDIFIDVKLEDNAPEYAIIDKVQRKVNVSREKAEK